MIKNDNGLERLDEGRFVLQGTLTVLFSLGMGFRDAGKLWKGKRLGIHPEQEHITK